MIDTIKTAVTRYAQAALGLIGISGVATTAVGTANHDNTTAFLGAIATFFGFLMHRHFSMRDVKNVVHNAVTASVTNMSSVLEERLARRLKEHEDHCKWVIRPSKELPPSEGGLGDG